MQNTIPTDILKIQKKLASFKKGSRNYNKYVSYFLENMFNSSV